MFDPIDVYIGKKLKVARILRDMTQFDLGSRIGVTLQQVQKYEKGYNRISASRLFSVAHVLGVDIDYFYTGLDGIENSGFSTEMLEEAGNDFEFNFTDHGEAISIARLYLQIKNSGMKKIIANLIREVLAEESGDYTNNPTQLITNKSNALAGNNKS